MIVLLFCFYLIFSRVRDPPNIEVLRAIAAEHGPRNFYARYVFGVRNWRRAGDMVQFIEIAHVVQGVEGVPANPAYCPPSVYSWVVFRVAIHNVKVLKKKMHGRRERKVGVTRVFELLDRAKKADVDGSGAKELATAEEDTIRVLIRNKF